VKIIHFLRCPSHTALTGAAGAGLEGREARAGIGALLRAPGRAEAHYKPKHTHKAAVHGKRNESILKLGSLEGLSPTAIRGCELMAMGKKIRLAHWQMMIWNRGSTPG